MFIEKKIVVFILRVKPDFTIPFFVAERDVRFILFNQFARIDSYF